MSYKYLYWKLFQAREENKSERLKIEGGDDEKNTNDDQESDQVGLRWT